jgi:hypothetical protein
MASITLNSEQLIEETLHLANEGVYDSIRQASLATGARRSTVGHRRAGRPPRSQITVRNARLTSKQETTLMRWITDLQLQYKPVNHTQLAKIAENLAHENDPSRPLGKNWVSRFIKRSPALNNGRSQPFPMDRIQSIIPHQLGGWYRHFEEVVHRYGIKPGNIWNMDEIGYQMGHAQKENVVFNRTMGPPKAVTTGLTAWVSVLECISMDGRALPPLVIHRGTLAHAPLDAWFPPSEECPDWYYGFTKKGWTDNDYSLAWLTEVFLPQTRQDDEWRLLLVDGHGSHSTGEFQWECLSNQVVLVYLLPHSTHLTQPADLGPFAHLKNHYNKNLKNYISRGRAVLDRAQFNLLYQETRRTALTRQYIQAGWSRTGLNPFNPSRVLESPEIIRYRQTTPDLLPPPSEEHRTPSTRAEFDAIAREILPTLTPKRRHQFQRLTHAYHNENATRVVLQTEEVTARKRAREEEEKTTTKRLRKNEEKLLWDLRAVMEARGLSDDEIENLLAHNPDRSLIFDST